MPNQKAESVTSVNYTPRGASARLMSLKDPECLVAGPSGTGKSVGCLWKLNLQALKYPGMRALITRKTQVSLTSSALVTWKKLVVPDLLRTGLLKFKGATISTPGQYTYYNGSIVALTGMDKAMKIMSTEFDVIYIQEATELTRDDWEALVTRLRSYVMPYQQIIADCNPAQPTHWLKQRVDAGSVTMLNSRHEDNPLLYDEDGKITEYGKDYIEGKLDKLTGVRYLRLRKGVWAAAEGVIYEEWDDAIHLVDKFNVPYEWERVWTIDWGFVHPAVLQMWAIDPDGNAVLYREIYHTKMLAEDLAKHALFWVRGGPTVSKYATEWKEPKPIAIVCDHDAEDRATFQKHIGLGTVAAIKDVQGGINIVKSMLKVQENGKPRLTIMRDARVTSHPGVDTELKDLSKPTCTYEEIGGYVWASGTKEAPVKELDDGMDAMRYMAQYLNRRQYVIPKIRVIGVD